MKTTLYIAICIILAIAGKSEAKEASGSPTTTQSQSKTYVINGQHLSRSQAILALLRTIRTPSPVRQHRQRLAAKTVQARQP